MFFFATLIVCQILDLYRFSNGKSDEIPTGPNVLTCVVCMIMMVAFLFLSSADSDVSLADLDAVDIVLLFVVGVVIVISKVVSGLSGAAILLAIGLHTVLMDLIGGMDLSVIMGR